MNKLYNLCKGRIGYNLKVFNLRLEFRISLIVLVFIISCQNMIAADRYSVAAGNWSSTATWSDVSGGIPGASLPSDGDNVYIEGGFLVTLNVNTGNLSLLNIASGSSFITSGTNTVNATAIIVDGIYRNASVGSITGTMTVNGTYQHAFTTTAGIIPTATWSAGSVCEITGYTTAGTTSPTIQGIGQEFSNFIWNCPNQTAALLLNNSVLSTTAGMSFMVISTGTGSVSLTQSPTFSSLAQTGGTLIIGQSAARTVTVTGNVILTEGTLNMSSAGSVVALNVAGDLSQASGHTITETGTGSGTVVFNSATAQLLTIAGAIQNTVNITISNSAGVTLGSDLLDLKGNIRVNAGGILDLLNWSVSSLGTVTVYASATTGALIKGSGSLTLGTALTVAGSGANYAIISCPVILGSSCNLNAAAGLTVSGVISGADYSITKSGAGTVILNAANSYTGATNITAGALNIQNASGLGSTDGGTFVTAGALQLQGGIAYNQEPLTIAGTGISSTGALRNISGVNTWTGTINLSSASMIYSNAGTLILNATNSISADNYNLTVAGAGNTAIAGSISTGSGTLRKSNGGTLTLSGANTYSGLTTVAGGVVNIQNASALGTIDGGTIVNTGYTLQLQGGITYDPEPITIAGAGISSLGAIRNVSGDNVWSGPVTLSAAARLYSTAGTLTINAVNAITANNFNLVVAGAGNVNVTGIIATGSGTLTKTNGGILWLTGSNTYTGATTVSAGVLNIQNASGLGTTDGATTVSSGAALQLQGGIVYNAEPLTLAGSGISATGALRSISGDNTWPGAITLTGATRIGSDSGTLTLNASGAITASNLSLVISGLGNTIISGIIATGSGTLTKLLTGTLTLSGANSYSGTTSISAGVINIQNAGALGTTAGYTTVSNGAALHVQGGISVSEPLRLYGSGINNGGALRNISGNNTWRGITSQLAASKIFCDSGSLTFDVTSGNAITGAFALTFDGDGAFAVSDPVAISTGTLIKSGKGTLTFSSANTYTGVTTISGGKLEYANSNAISTGRVALNGGSFSTGQANGYSDAVGNLTLSDNSIIALGTGSHTLTFTNSSAVTWTTGTLLTITGWTGPIGSSGTAGRIFFGSTASGLTVSQLGQVLFFVDGSYWTSKLLATGELVPTTAANAIITGVISGSAFCPGSTGITIPFTYSIASNYTSSTFTAQLSDVTGSFISPLSLGTVISDVSGNQSITNVTIPESAPIGTGYRIRVISDSPVIYGFDNGSDISVSVPLSDVIISPVDDQTTCLEGSGITLLTSETGGGAITRQWGKRAAPGGAITGIPGAAGSTYLPSGADVGEGIWYLVCTSTSGCGTSAISNEVRITVLANGTWIGGALGYETDWDAESNWCGGVPSGSDNIIISSSSTDFPVIPASSVFEGNNLTIGSGASLTIEAGGALTVVGDLSNSGTLTIGSGFTTPDLTPSGSLIVGGTSSGNVTYNRQFKTYSVEDTYTNFDWHFFSSPVETDVAPASNPANSGKITAIYEWNEASGAQGSWDLTTSSLTDGRGYNLDQSITSEGMISFTGTIIKSASVTATSPYLSPVDLSTIEEYQSRWESSARYPDNFGGGGWNLLGNPFTSALKVSDEDAVSTNDFLSVNSASFDPNYIAVYIYDGSVEPNGLYNYTGISIPGDGETFVQTGQGFFVLAGMNNVEFIFTSEMQKHNVSGTMLKKSDNKGTAWPSLQLKALYGAGKVSATSIVFNSAMTLGLDPGYDVGLISSRSPVEIYTHLVQDNGINFTRQALPIPGSEGNIVAVGVDSENGGEVTFSGVIVPLEGYKFILEDRSTGKLTDLSTDTYTVTIPAKIYGTGRFFIHITNGTQTTIDPVDPEQMNVRIWASGSKVIIKGTVGEKAVAEVYDIQGRKIYDNRLTDASFNSFDLPSASKGVYIIVVKDGAKVYKQKVVVL